VITDYNEIILFMLILLELMVSCCQNLMTFIVVFVAERS